MITTVVADGKNEYEFIDLLKKRAQNSDKNVVPIVSEIIENVAENGDKAVVQQILSDLAMAHIAETHAVHLRSVFFIQLLLRRPVIPTATPYQFFFRHGFQSYRSSVAIDERGS